MKKTLFSLLLLPLLVLPLAGCPAASTTPPPAVLAPGYSSTTDQKLGQSLAALNAFVNSEKDNFQCNAPAKMAGTCLSSTQQAAEKVYLNSFIDAVTVANTTYTAFHQGTGTLQQAESSVTAAQTAQASLASSKGVK